MGEPWLDSLSEDWKSEHQSSSPAASISSRQRYGSVALTQSQSRIPHLAKAGRRESSGLFLKHRSKRSLSRSQTEPVLTERSASSLNVPPPQTGSEKRTNASTFPRRSSNAFSDSQNSVQHYSLRGSVSKANTPEWKRRIAQGDDIASDGFDLFAPSKLEGIFKGPTSRSEKENESSLLEGLSRPWDSYKAPSTISLPEQYQSLRASRNRPPGMEPLHEVDEEDAELALSAISSDLVRGGSLRGLVHKRVQSLERIKNGLEQPSPPTTRPNTASGLESADDPRWRTFSGRQEIENEFISPITASRQNTIRDKALKESTEVDIDALDRKLAQIGIDTAYRPSSSSSDRDVSYNHGPDSEQERAVDPHFGDITSQSLPDDLSMGTQDFISQGGYVNPRRGAPSGDVSLLKPRQSSLEFSRVHPQLRQPQPSSPPSFHNIDHGSVVPMQRLERSPDAPQNDSNVQWNDTSVVHHEEAEAQSKPASPLKLFGNRDTYTNNKLMRILSHFDDSRHTEEDQQEQLPTILDQNLDELRMSHFGQGELENFNFEFEKQLSLSPQERRALELEGSPIFKTQHAAESASAATRAEPHDGPKVSSPARSPKRRRTLLQDEICVDCQPVEVKFDQFQDTNLLAGTKRKDARPGDAGTHAEAAVLASRTLLQPRGSRRSSSASKFPELPQTTEECLNSPEASQEVAEALAAELASFAQEVAQVQNDSRKPSLATKDYMEEANKVMQFIRSRGKPQPVLPEIEEPANQSELDPDKILDLVVDDESTKDEFSRPPSREGPRRPSPDRRHAIHDHQTASHLRKYREDDDLELLANTSGLGTLRVADNRAAQQASQVPVPDDSDDDDKQESSPPNIRILNHAQSLRKRKHSASTIEDQSKGLAQVQTTGSSGESTQRTFPTSSSSGQKGMITSGTVSIPDQVGKMTYDHHQQRWIPAEKPHRSQKSKARSERTVNSEADPFENIPDLSIDENIEEEGKQSSRPGTMDSKTKTRPAGLRRGSITQELPVRNPRLREDGKGENQNSSVRSEVSKHEAMLHDGLASRPPMDKPDGKKQPRVVTIAFSSPVVSAVQYPDDLSDMDDEVDLPLDDSEVSNTPKSGSGTLANSMTRAQDQKYEQYRAMTTKHRPVSPIDEHDEGQINGEMSLIHVNQVQELTPIPKHHNQQLIQHRQTKGHNSSILCLTPLSDFTVHQLDQAKHPEHSFVEERVNPKALRQAHGSLALQVDSLVKAITDEEPSEVYWEHIRKMRLESKALSSLHGLVDYCSGLEQLSVANNKIAHLNGLPSSLRVLNMQNNCLTSLASWSQLQNLQYVDVSNNQLENLDGFGCLIHLRKLVAKDNAIRGVDGIFELDGLLELQLQGNNIDEIDFGTCALDRLRKLDLGKNQLKRVRNIHQLISLETLNLSGNQLQALPIGESITSIKSMDVSHNWIETIDLALLPTIETLVADSNCIQRVAGLKEAYNLATLSLRSQAGISNLVSEVLGLANECRSIFLSSNAVPGGSISLPELPQCNVRELELAGCGISVLPGAFGDFFPNCRKLNLNYNAIQDLSTLQGMSRLSKLEIARNRIKRMRRTCLALARLDALSQVELRDNPLTLGFYPPAVGSRENAKDCDAYTLPSRDAQNDVQWLARLDETTQLKRRAVELLLAEGCPNLKWMDGSRFEKRVEFQADVTWDSLTQRGVLVKLDAQQEAEAEGSLPLHVDEGIDMGAMSDERSLLVE